MHFQSRKYRLGFYVLELTYSLVGELTHKVLRWHSKTLLKEKVDRLRGLLEDEPKKLGNKDAQNVICYLDVDEIISLGLKSDQGNGSEQCWVAEVGKWTEDEGDCEKVADVVRTMLCYVEIVKRAEFKLLYEKLSPKVFTALLLAAMDSNYIRRSGGGPPLIKAEERGEWFNTDTETIIQQALQTGVGPNVSDAYTISDLPGLYATIIRPKLSSKFNGSLYKLLIHSRRSICPLLFEELDLSLINIDKFLKGLLDNDPQAIAEMKKEIPEGS